MENEEVKEEKTENLPGEQAEKGQSGEVEELKEKILKLEAQLDATNRMLAIFSPKQEGEEEKRKREEKELHDAARNKLKEVYKNMKI